MSIFNKKRPVLDQQFEKDNTVYKVSAIAWHIGVVIGTSITDSDNIIILKGE